MNGGVHEKYMKFIGTVIIASTVLAISVARADSTELPTITNISVMADRVILQWDPNLEDVIIQRFMSLTNSPEVCAFVNEGETTASISIPASDCGRAFFRLLVDKHLVHFADSNLEASIRIALKAQHTPNGNNETNLSEIESLTPRKAEIYSLDGIQALNSLRILELTYSHISDLSPLVTATNLVDLNLYANDVINLAPLTNLIGLRQLSLDYNMISDVSALSGLTNLQFLNISHNHVHDLSPLINNAASGGLGPGDRVWIRGNPVDPQKIQELESYGVEVNIY